MIPTKFLLICAQIILLVVAIGDVHYHVVKELDHDANDSLKYDSARKTTMGLLSSWMALCFFEFLMMVLGISVPHIFAQYNLVQILLHFLGCIFTIWYILDTWVNSDLWAMWTFFCLVPIFFESVIIVSAFKLNRDFDRNLAGRVK